MKTIKLTSWNIEHLDYLTGNDLDANKKKRKNAIKQEINELNPDILCVIEAPNKDEKIDAVCDELFENKYLAIKSIDGNYAMKGTQWIRFLVKSSLFTYCSLLPIDTWYNFSAGKYWDVNYWGDYEADRHSHYRNPQTLILSLDGQRIEIIGVHLKSKFVNQGKRMWEGPEDEHNRFIHEALKARIKMATETDNIRKYINTKFAQVENPAIIVVGDFNDGPGKEFFEKQYLFFDLISNIQGDIFSAHKFLNHALFDFPENLRWSVYFKDFVEETRDPHILLDHILFSQGFVNGQLPVAIEPHAGRIEHEIHDLINSQLTSKQKTSDHKPISVNVSFQD